MTHRAKVCYILLGFVLAAGTAVLLAALAWAQDSAASPFNWTSVVNTFIGSLPLLLTAIAGFVVTIRKQDKVIAATDGMKSDLVKLAGEKGQAVGELTGAANEQVRVAAKKVVDAAANERLSIVEGAAGAKAALMQGGQIAKEALVDGADAVTAATGKPVKQARAGLVPATAGKKKRKAK